MKIRLLSLVALSLAACAGPALATDLVGSTLNIYTSSANTFGTGVTGVGAFGDDNIIAASGTSLVLGYDNYELEADGIFQMGQSNTVNGSFNFVQGEWNSVGSSESAVVMGIANTLSPVYDGVADLIIGTNNALTANGGILIGNGLSLSSASGDGYFIGENIYKIIIGNYNATVTNPLLVVGNGTDSTHTHNALEITQDGKINMPVRQGDVGMGRFGNTGDE